MESVYQFQKQINSEKLKREISQASLPAPKRIDTVSTTVYVAYESELSEAQQDTLSSVVSAHQAITTTDEMYAYLQEEVKPFIDRLIASFAAENIAMGITQAGKTGEVLALFEERFSIAGVSRPVSLKGSFDTGSLYISLAIIQHVRNDSNLYAGLFPYVTDARLLRMKNDIEAFLGLTPSE